MKVEISSCGDKLSFTAAEDHTITRVDVKTKDKIIPEGTEILQIRLPKGTLAIMNSRLIEAIPQLIIVDCDPKEVNVTGLLPFLEKEQAESCPHGFNSTNDEKLQDFRAALLGGHKTDARKICLDCEQLCIVRDVFNPEKIRDELVEMYGLVWDTAEVQKDFNVTGFNSPFAFVERKSDGKTGTLRFTHDPRFYFQFEESS